MNVIEAIHTRRSIRKHTGEPVSPKDIEVILKAGFQAPSAHNLQPRDYIVVKNKDTLERITEAHPHAKMLARAGLGIIVCGDVEKQSEIGFLVADCAAAIQNMLLAAHGIGLGAVWCGLHPKPHLTDSIRDICELPPQIIPVGLIAIGHTDEKKEAQERFNPAKLHYDKW